MDMDVDMVHVCHAQYVGSGVFSVQEWSATGAVEDRASQVRRPRSISSITPTT